MLEKPDQAPPKDMEQDRPVIGPTDSQEGLLDPGAGRERPAWRAQERPDTCSWYQKDAYFLKRYKSAQA